jgi:hypothetical protein
MGKIIKVHDLENDEIYINTDSINMFARYKCNDYTLIQTIPSRHIEVNETPEEILKLINEVE